MYKKIFETNKNFVHIPYYVEIQSFTIPINPRGAARGDEGKQHTEHHCTKKTNLKENL